MDTNVLFWIGGGSVGLAGLAMLWWAMFADRSRGRRRCPKCWYDMAKSEGLRCPECGREAKSEKAMFRTRRRWKQAFASVVVLLGAGLLAIQPKVQEDGWASIMPKTILILCVWTNDPEWAMDEIESRTERVTDLQMVGSYVADLDSLWDWQWRMLARAGLHLLQSEQPSDVRKRGMLYAAFGAEALRNDTDVTWIFDDIEQCIDDRDAEVRSYAIASLAGHPDGPRAIEIIRGILVENDAATLVAASIALHSLMRKDDQALPLALEASQHGASSVRSLAARALGFHGERESASLTAFEALERLSTDSSSGVRRNAFIAMLKFKAFAPQGERVLRNAATNHDAEVRQSALAAMTDKNRPQDAARLLVEGLKDESPDVRREAAFGLRCLTRDELLPVLARVREIVPTITDKTVLDDLSEALKIAE